MGKYYSVPVARQICGLSPVDMAWAIRRLHLVTETVHGRQYLSENQLALLANFDPATARYRAPIKIEAPVNQ
jgi:hypothetical protein